MSGSLMNELSELTTYLFVPVIAAIVVAITQPGFVDAPPRRTLASHVPRRTT